MSVLRLMAVGDISLQAANDKHPFANVKEVLQGKDILFGNLETVLSDRGVKAEKAVLLYSPPEKVDYLKDAGFDILNIANNHIMDLGVEGFDETLKVLNEKNLTFIGANNKPGRNYAILEKERIGLGFLGYCASRSSQPKKGVWINRIKLADIIRDIEAITPQCDFVIISLHWGTENVFYPSPKQIDLAHKLIDRGATLILGHHPHVIQGVEEYKNGLVAYSLGNFQFNSQISQTKINKSIVLSVDFSEQGIKNYRIIPVAIDEDFLPHLVEGREKDRSLHFIAEISQPIKNGKVTNKWWFEEIANEYLSGNLRSSAVRIRKYGIRHLLKCIIWLISPFCLRCYAAIIRQRLRRFLSGV